MVYGVLGVGSIGAAIVTGLCENVDEAPKVLLSPRNARISAGLARRFATVDVASDNQAVVDGARVVLVCVGPADRGMTAKSRQSRASCAPTRQDFVWGEPPG